MTLAPLPAAILRAVQRGDNTRWAIGLCPDVQAAAYRLTAQQGGTVHSHIQSALGGLFRGGHLRRADPRIAGAWVVSQRDHPPGPLQLRLLDALRLGPATTMDLVARTGAPRPSVWRAAERLVSRGLAKVIERRRAIRGRPRPVYALTGK